MPTAAPTIGCTPNRSFPVSMLSKIPATSKNRASDISVLVSPTKNLSEIPASMTSTINIMMLKISIF